MTYIHIFTVLIVGYFALFVATKILGKTQITQITPFDFISAIVLGELVGNVIFEDHIKLSEMLFSILIWVILIYTTEYITQKFMKTRGILEGNPSIIIHKGKIDYNELKNNHLDINQLQLLLRQKDIFAISECEFAILETNGTISALKKPEYTAPSAQDLNLTLNPIDLPVSLILDGEVVFDNLQNIGWDVQKLMLALKSVGIDAYEEVLYAEWKPDEPLHVQRY